MEERKSVAESEDFEQRSFTVEEMKYFEEAKARHLVNLTKKQVVQGRVFSGAAFISKPEKIEFKDFTVGETHTQVIQLTNVSYSFQSFKVVPLREVIREYFELQYVPHGRMSAGTSCTLTVRFTPLLNSDIFDFLRLEAQTGPINIPIECTSKKSGVKCLNSVVDFGLVIEGESKVCSLQLVNKGALPTAMIFRDESGKELPEDELELQRMPAFSELEFRVRNQIHDYESITIPIRYKPKQLGSLELCLELYFFNFLHSPPVKVRLRGTCVEVPVEVERRVYDLETCLLGHIYREKILFRNKSDNPMKIQVHQPSVTKGYFEFNPLLGYIQGKSSFEVWLKFNAEKDLTSQFAEFHDGQAYRVPFKLVGADQVTPVYFDVCFKITSDHLHITPNKLEFGRIFEGTGVKLPISIENCSDLPQELMFYPLPKQISVELDMIPIKILPREKIQTRLIFRSEKLTGTSSKREEGILRCKIITGKLASSDQRLPYSCEVVKPDLSISRSKIELPALQRGQSCNTTIELKNISQKAIVFQMFPPEYQLSGLTITPVVKNLLPQQTTDIHVLFKSFFKKIGPFTTRNIKLLRDKQLKPKEFKESKEDDKKDSKKDTKKKEEPPKKLSKAQQDQLELELKKQQELERQKQEEQQALRDEAKKNFVFEKELHKLGGKLYQFPQPLDLPCPSEGEAEVDFGPNYCQIYDWLVPVYFKQVGMPDASKNITFIEITTVTVERSLCFDKTVIDFGEVAVGVRQIRQLQITNHSKETMKLKMDLLPSLSGFSVINALRDLAPGKTNCLIVEFYPYLEQPFEETLTIRSQTTCVSCQLRGVGVRPEVTIDPENGLLNMGCVLVDESSEKQFKVKNVSRFAVRAQFTKKARGVSNNNESEPFYLSSTEALIEPGKELEVKVRFKPDRVSQKYYELLLIYIPFQKSQKYIYLYGSSYPRQAYVLPRRVVSAVPKLADLVKPEFAFDTLRYKDEELICSHLNNRIVLEFTKAVGKGADNPASCFERKLVVGSCRLLDSKLEKPSNFEVIIAKDDRFSCDQVKGTAAPGTDAVITFTFKPPEQDPFIAKIEALSHLGQWKQFKCELRLSGGFVKPGATDLVSYEVLLRGYINEI